MQTHSSEHTHTVNTHPEQWATIYAAAPGEQFGVRYLAQGHLVVVLKVERAHSLPSSLPDQNSYSQPFDYESDSLPLGHAFRLHDFLLSVLSVNRHSVLIFFFFFFFMFMLQMRIKKHQLASKGKVTLKCSYYFHTLKLL